MPESPIERVSQTTPDLSSAQVERLKQLFPECVTEGRVDFDRLRATLGDLEKMKIECARRHFGTVEVDYDAVSSAQEMRERILGVHSGGSG